MGYSSERYWWIFFIAIVVNVFYPAVLLAQVGQGPSANPIRPYRPITALRPPYHHHDYDDYNHAHHSSQPRRPE